MSDTTEPADDPVSTDDKLDEVLRRLDDDKHDVLEVVATVLLGFAAVLIAFSVLQSSLWGGKQDEALTRSILTNTEATDLLQAGDSNSSLDLILFIESFTSGACDPDTRDEFVCAQIRENMSDPGLEAFEKWLGNDEFLPFDTDEYRQAIYGDGEALQEESARYFDEADEANKNSDRYEFASTVLTVALFFAGVSLVLKRNRTRIGLCMVSSGFIVGAVIYLLTLPRLWE